MSRKGFLLALFLVAPLLTAGAASAETVFKMATLAPEGSSWMRLFHEWATSVEKKTAGRVKFKFFPGGVQGDERDAVRKMRMGQVNGAAVTGVGLGLINAEVRALELPFLFRNDAELDFARASLDSDFQKKFAEKGYVLLAWGDVGAVHVFTNAAVKTREDLIKAKMWAWVDDPLFRALFKNLGLQGVPLGVPDVLPSLQTGLIDACYGSALSTMALQWHTKVRFMTSQAVNIAVGATVVTKKDFQSLSADDQKAMLEEGKALQQKILDVVRRDNQRALAKMKSLGLQVIETPGPLVDQMRTASLKVWDELGGGKMYSNEWLERLKKILADYRKTHP